MTTKMMTTSAAQKIAIATIGTTTPAKAAETTIIAIAPMTVHRRRALTLPAREPTTAATTILVAIVTTTVAAITVTAAVPRATMMTVAARSIELHASFLTASLMREST